MLWQEETYNTIIFFTFLSEENLNIQISCIMKIWENVGSSIWVDGGLVLLFKFVTVAMLCLQW